MSANGQLVFTDVDKITFKGVGNASNAVIDTLTGKIGVGIDSPEANLHVVGNSYVSTNLELGGTLIMGTVNVEAQHSLEAVTATGNTTPLTIEFTNPTTSLVASGNVEVGGNVVAGYLYGDGSNISGISSNLDQIVNIGNVTSNTVQFTNATTGLVTTANVEVGGELTVSGNTTVSSNLTVSGNVVVTGSITGRIVTKTRTITHGTSLSGEVDTYTLETDENRIVLNNAQGTAGSSRTYTANFNSGVPTEVGTIMYLEINSSRTATSAAGVNHKTEIQFGGTKVLSTGDNYIASSGTYSKTLKRVIILTSNGWEDITEIKHGDNGRVGIGQSSPSTKLHIGSGDVGIDRDQKFDFGAGYSANWYIKQKSADNKIYFERTGGNGNELVIDTSGNVGIGTATPRNRNPGGGNPGLSIYNGRLQVGATEASYNTAVIGGGGAIARVARNNFLNVNCDFTFPRGFQIVSFGYINFHDANITNTQAINVSSGNGPYRTVLAGSLSYIQISTLSSNTLRFRGVNLPSNYNDWGLYHWFSGYVY